MHSFMTDSSDEETALAQQLPVRVTVDVDVADDDVTWRDSPASEGLALPGPIAGTFVLCKHVITASYMHNMSLVIRTYWYFSLSTHVRKP